MGSRGFGSMVTVLALVASVGLSVAGVPSPVAAAAKKPDLKVTAPAGAVASLTPGGPVSATVTVSSTVPAKKTTTSLTLSSDGAVGPGDVILAQAPTKLKAPKGTRGGKSKPKATLTLAGTVPAGTSPGSYSLIACADAAGKVKEKNEKNNCAVTVVKVAKPGPTDTTPPAAPSIGTITPASPSNNPSPTVSLTGEPGARVDVYRQAACAGPVAASISLPSGGSAGLPVPVNHNTANTLTAKAVDLAGNASPCAVSRSYVHDDIAPAAPTVGFPVPFFTGRAVNAVYRGTAEAGSTVLAHDFGSDCFFDADISASAATFSTSGVAVSGDANDVSFEAVDAAGNHSPCVELNRGQIYKNTFLDEVTETTSPNDSTGTAQTLDIEEYGGDPVSVYGSLSASSGADNNDYYKIVLQHSGYTLAGEVRGRSIFGSPACDSTTDPKLYIYDESGAAMASVDDVGGGNFCARFDGVSSPDHNRGNRSLPAGTYYLRVQNLGSNSFDYELAFDVGLDIGSAQPTEPDNSSGTATALKAPFDSGFTSISSATDHDWYTFVAATGSLRVDVLAPQGQGQPTCGADSTRIDTFVTVYASNGSTVMGSNDDLSPQNYCSRLNLSSLTAGERYYVEVTRAPSALPASPTFFSYVLTLRQ
jgi:CARDB protein